MQRFAHRVVRARRAGAAGGAVVDGGVPLHAPPGAAPARGAQARRPPKHASEHPQLRRGRARHEHRHQAQEGRNVSCVVDKFRACLCLLVSGMSYIRKK